MRRSSSRRHMRSRCSSICSGRGGVVIGLRAAGSAKGNFWLDSALENRTIASLPPVRLAPRPFWKTSLSCSYGAAFLSIIKKTV
jgi:hypothetical protein